MYALGRLVGKRRRKVEAGCHFRIIWSEAKSVTRLPFPLCLTVNLTLHCTAQSSWNLLSLFWEVIIDYRILKTSWGKRPEILSNWFTYVVMISHTLSLVWLKASQIKLRKNSWTQKADVFISAGQVPFLSSFQFHWIILFKSVEFSSFLHLEPDKTVAINTEQPVLVSYWSRTALVQAECFPVCAQLWTRRHWKRNTVLQRQECEAACLTYLQSEKDLLKCYFNIRSLLWYYFWYIRNSFKCLHLGRTICWTTAWKFTRNLLSHPGWRVVHTWAK